MTGALRAILGKIVGCCRGLVGVYCEDEVGRNCDPDDGVKRTSNSLIAASYCITAIIGVGVLGLPHAMVFLTWAGGPIVLFVAFVINYFTMTQLIILHEFELENKDRRYETYYKLGIRALGNFWGFWLIQPLQMVVEVSLDILFTVAAGEAMERINVKRNGPCIHRFTWFAVFAVIQMVLSLMVPSFSSKILRVLVIIAAIMSTCYSTIAWISIISVGGGPKGGHGLPSQLPAESAPSPPPAHLTSSDLVFQAFNAIGVVAVAYAAHNVVLETQNGIPSYERKRSKNAMLHGVWITYVVVAMCYFPISIAVYAAYGNTISQNALGFMLLIDHHSEIKGAFIAANIMLIIHVIGSYQIFAFPVFEQLTKTLNREEEEYENGERRIRYPPWFIKIAYISFTLIVAMGFPYFSSLGFIGGFAIAPTAYILPCILWLCIQNQETTGNPQPRRLREILGLLFIRNPARTLQWYFNWACIILGVLLMIVATIGGLGVLIQGWKTSGNYKLWHHNWRELCLKYPQN